jgi:hypothetical protein
MKQRLASPWFAALLLALGLGPAAANPAPAPFFVANWNVENLYDAVDDPDNDYDDEFLPNNVTTRWTQVRYETKHDNLARVIADMNHGEGPDLLGLQKSKTAMCWRTGRASRPSPTASSTTTPPTPAASIPPCSTTGTCSPSGIP